MPDKFIEGTKPGNVYVQGTLGFSYLTGWVEGDALTKYNLDRHQKFGQNGSKVIDQSRPFMSATLDNPVILKPETVPPENIQYIHEHRFFMSHSGGVEHWAMTAEVAQSLQSGPNTPKMRIFALGDDGKYHPFTPTRSLASGLKVMVALQFYPNKKYSTMALGVQGLFILEKPRYYSSFQGTDPVLVDLGIVVADDEPIVLDDDDAGAPVDEPVPVDAYEPPAVPQMPFPQAPVSYPATPAVTQAPFPQLTPTAYPAAPTQPGIVVPNIPLPVIQ